MQVMADVVKRTIAVPADAPMPLESGEAPALHAKDGRPLWRVFGADQPGECSVCWGKGALRTAEGSYVLCPECQRRHVRARISRLNGVSSWSQSAVGQTFETYAPYDAGTKAALAAVQRWAKGEGQRWIYLHGVPGCGKTHLAAAAANYLTGEGEVPTLFITMPEMLRWLREAFDQGPNDAGERMDYSSRLQVVQSAPVLILDDLGAEKGSEWVDEVTWLVLDARYRAQAPTFIASNVAPGNMRDARITSRLGDRALVSILQVAAGDFRRKSASERRALGAKANF